MIHSIPQKRTIIGHFDAIDGQTVRIKKFFWGNRAVETNEVTEAAEINEAAEVSKAQKNPTDDFSVILDLKYIHLRAKRILFWCFKKKNGRLTKTHFEF